MLTAEAQQRQQDLANARMIRDNWQSTLAQNGGEKKRLETAIASLESLAAKGGDDISPRRRGRKSMGEAERRVVSERMKKYWANWQVNKVPRAAATA